jgi:DNA replication protein DnaC
MRLRDTALRICRDRGITPADTLDEPHINPSAFYRHQLADVIHRRWSGAYDDATCDHPTVSAWVTIQESDGRRKPSLLIAGSTGSGKTWQAVGALKAIANHAASTHGRRIDWQMVSHPDLGDELRGDGMDRALAKYLDAELLILDDLGATMTTPWMTDCIQRLVDRRWSKRLTTIYTSNLTGNALSAAIGDRVYSRLGDAVRVTLADRDRRWKQ